MSEKEIGRCKCPLCKSDKASVRLSAKQLPYIVCNACNAQMFARSDRSDALMRAAIVAQPAVELVPDPTPAAPAPGLPAWAVAGEPPTRKMGWGVLGGAA
jgi:hypothetical protein